MDLLFMFMGVLCLAKGVDLFTGNDFLMFVGSTKKEDYDLDKVYGTEKWTSLIDAACSFGVGMNRLSRQVRMALLVPFAAIPVVHVYVFKSKKFRKESQQ